MSLVSYFWPQTIARFSSRYNKDIRVTENFGKFSLIVNGSIQSGPLIITLWRKALGSFRSQIPDHPRSILVLGVAGGTVIRILRSLYQDAAMTGVEIDPMMLTIARKYFSLHADRALTLVTEDARIFVNRAVRSKRTFDLVLVDTFFGRYVVPWVSDTKVLRMLKRLVGRDGAIIINFLRENEYREKSDVLLDKLQIIFHAVQEKAVARNRFFCATP